MGLPTPSHTAIRPIRTSSSKARRPLKDLQVSICIAESGNRTAANVGLYGDRFPRLVERRRCLNDSASRGEADWCRTPGFELVTRAGVAGLHVRQGDPIGTKAGQGGISDRHASSRPNRFFYRILVGGGTHLHSRGNEHANRRCADRNGSELENRGSLTLLHRTQTIWKKW
jgi:hypothetical protein